MARNPLRLFHNLLKPDNKPEVDPVGGPDVSLYMHSVTRGDASHLRGVANMASTVPAKNNSKMILATVGVAVIAAGAYGLGRVYPPLGETSGTIAPAERYRSSQVDASGVIL